VWVQDTMPGDLQLYGKVDWEMGQSACLQLTQVLASGKCMNALIQSNHQAPEY
jgi:hypothetical protein